MKDEEQKSVVKKEIFSFVMIVIFITRKLKKRIFNRQTRSIARVTVLL
jgi:hypothetical protein